MGPLYAAVVHGCRAGRNQEVLDEVFWKRIQRGGEFFNLNKLGAFGAEVVVLSVFFDPPWERLTPREREVLKLVAEGSKNREIADFLCISLKTVEKHRDSLMKKLDLHSAAALTAYAIEKGLVGP